MSQSLVVSIAAPPCKVLVSSTIVQHILGYTIIFSPFLTVSETYFLIFHNTGMVGGVPEAAL